MNNRELDELTESFVKTAEAYGAKITEIKYNYTFNTAVFNLEFSEKLKKVNIDGAIE